MKDAIINLAFLLVPTLGVLWAWKSRTDQSRTWREYFSFFALIALTANLAYSAVFLLWPYFGARVGSGVARWEFTGRLAQFGLWLGVLSLVLALFGRKQRLAIGGLSLVGIAFWFTMQIPIADFYAVESVRQAASHTTMPNR